MDPVKRDHINLALQPDSERILAYMERVQIFLKTNSISEEKQVPVLLSVVCGQTMLMATFMNQHGMA